MKFHKATKDDLQAIVALLADDELGALREQSAFDPYLKAFEWIESDPNQHLMVLVSDGGQVIGTFQLSYIQYLTYSGGLRAQIEAVRVHKDFRGKGIGKKMIQWAIDNAREQGAHVVQLTSDLKRPEAIAFYRSMGFISSHSGMKLHL